MQLTSEQFEQIEGWLPRQRGNVSLDNLQVLNAILHVAANSCKWRALSEGYGNWHTLYTRMMRWSQAGVLDCVFEQLQRQRLMQVRIEAVSLDSTTIKAHPDAAGAPKKNGPQALGRSRGGWGTKLHLVAADDRNVITWSLTPGQAGDAPEGRRLIEALGPHQTTQVALLDGQRLPRQRHARSGTQLGAAAGGAAQPATPPALGPRQAAIPKAQSESSGCSDA